MSQKHRLQEDAVLADKLAKMSNTPEFPEDCCET